MEKRTILLVDSDHDYLNRVLDYCKQYRDGDLSLICVDNVEEAEQSLAQCDAVVCAEGISFNPHDCRTYQLVKIREKKGIFKYQKASDLMDAFYYAAEQPKPAKWITFFPCQLGVGTSTAAAAFCTNLSRRGKRVLRVNLQQFGIVQEGGDGSPASRPTAETLYRHLIRGEYDTTPNYSSITARSHLTMLEFEEFVKKIDFDYDYVIVDADIFFDDVLTTCFKRSERIVLVTDGTQFSNQKAEELYWIFGDLENQEQQPLRFKTRLLYNRFRQGVGQLSIGIETAVLGRIDEFSADSEKQHVDGIAQLPIWDSLEK